jgi:transcriptional regulator with XRE-family HTH domain
MSKEKDNELNMVMGLRLKAARLIYNEGIKLSVEQFAHLLNITTEKLLNYESGRSSIPHSGMLELYHRGINPVFIITGEKDILVNNGAGNALRRSMISKNINYSQIVRDYTISKSKDLSIAPEVFIASAGTIIEEFSEDDRTNI